MAVRRALEGRTFTRIWRERFGFSAEALRAHLMGTLPEGCTVDEVEVDHVRPKRGFAYERPEDPGFKAAWSLANLRLLPAAWHRLRA